ncbi:HNH endonuclease [Sutterella sp.]|uniref:HNH endonuclease n=1 Tax=Sutterella sp. TaxID=1981025 RepID=UPI0026DED834|nr:HNH endonuclease signature motif containing protein [Sutterella sp.]MDO5531413.1 HNH endonuclease signature motif containing protein [Sutterella sp.]
MPLLSFCRYPGCSNTVPYGEKYCERHQAAGAQKERERERARWKLRQRKRGSSTARGYGSHWQRLRAAFLREHPLCEICKEAGRLTPATDVDHIIPHRGDQALLWDRDNLQALCHECHSRKTAREDGGFGNRTK